MNDHSKIVRDIESKPEHIALVDSLYSNLKIVVFELIQGDISKDNIILVIDAAMKLVAKMRLEGIEKKAIVITVVKRLIAESSLKPEDSVIINLIVDQALDSTIDQLFSLAPKVYGKMKASCIVFCKK